MQVLSAFIIAVLTHQVVDHPDQEFCLFFFDLKVIDDILKKRSCLFTLNLPVKGVLPVGVNIRPLGFPDSTAVIRAQNIKDKLRRLRKSNPYAWDHVWPPRVILVVS